MASTILTDLPSFLNRKLDEFGISPGATVLLGFSGGKDSTALLALLARLTLPGGWGGNGESRPRGPHSTSGSPRIKLIAVNIHHHLREEDEMAHEFALASRVCIYLGVPLIRVHGNLLNPGTSLVEKGYSTEERARRFRLFHLRRLQKELNAEAVLLGHHRDDQLETILHQICSGRSFHRIKGMPESAPPVFRPLLQIPQNQLLAYLDQVFGAHHRIWHEDSSNASSEYLRNRLRHEALPLLRSLYPGLDKNLLRGFEGSKQDYQTLKTLESVFFQRFPWEYHASTSTCLGSVSALEIGEAEVLGEWIKRGIALLHTRHPGNRKDALYGYGGPRGLRFSGGFISSAIQNLKDGVLTSGYGVVIYRDNREVVINPELALKSKRGYLCVLKKGGSFERRLPLPVKTHELVVRQSGGLPPGDILLRSPRLGEYFLLQNGIKKPISKLWHEYHVPMRLRGFCIILEQAGEKTAILVFQQEESPMVIPLKKRNSAASEPDLVFHIEPRYGVTQ